MDELDTASIGFLRGGCNGMFTLQVNGTSLFDTIAALVAKVKAQDAQLVHLNTTVQRQQEELGKLALAVVTATSEASTLRAELSAKCEAAVETSKYAGKEAQDTASHVMEHVTSIQQKYDKIVERLADLDQGLEVRSAESILVNSRVDDVVAANRATDHSIQELGQRLEHLQQIQQQSFDVTSLRKTIRGIAADIDALYLLWNVDKEDVHLVVAEHVDPVERVKRLHSTPAFHLLWTELYHISQLVTQQGAAGGSNAGQPSIAANESLITPGVLGLEVSEGKTRKGVHVVSVRKGTPAYECGLQGGDVIVGINDIICDNKSQLQLALHRVTPGSQIKVVSVPAGRLQPMSAVLTVPQIPQNVFNQKLVGTISSSSGTHQSPGKLVAPTTPNRSMGNKLN
eukprot:PhF_6_TR42738/c0_g1_i1/m.64592